VKLSAPNSSCTCSVCPDHALGVRHRSAEALVHEVVLHVVEYVVSTGAAMDAVAEGSDAPKLSPLIVAEPPPLAAAL
jgi:hypothetical protein